MFVFEQIYFSKCLEKKKIYLDSHTIYLILYQDTTEFLTRTLKQERGFAFVQSSYPLNMFQSFTFLKIFKSWSK